MPDTERQELRNFICTKLIKIPDYPLKNDDALISGGLIDSYSLTHIVLYIEDRFKIEIPDQYLNAEQMDCINDIVNLAEELSQ